MPLRMSAVSMRLASNQAWLPLHSRDCTSTVYQQIVRRVNGRTSRAAASPQVNHRIAVLALLLTVFAQIHALLQVLCRTAVYTHGLFLSFSITDSRGAISFVPPFSHSLCPHHGSVCCVVFPGCMWPESCVVG
ncbi:hypothetical protein FB45DRAFT_1067143 [Roridomyces roridus]|uniref:Uncharacterized protein n=1 Tax=Roridomyces roridus TaxID=1738132 RepID=A0AAD7FBJ8_9AGAR|nr:hypothetical protein FB45DRAFT_1067143 [Roridomyces roridus]